MASQAADVPSTAVRILRAPAVGETQSTEPAEAGTVPNLSGDEGLRWPDEASEAEFLARERTSDDVSAPTVKADLSEADEEEPEQKQALPSLQALVDRIPASSRDLLEELFRAKFVAVRRVKKNALK